MQYFAIAAALLLATAATFIVSRYQAELSGIRARIIGDSEVLTTALGDVEYSVKGTGPPVLALHGAGGGYDQGILLGQAGFGDSFALISVSRFGYLRSPIPEDSSLKAQAAIYALVLDHLQMERVIVLAGSAGGPSALQFAHDFPHRCIALILISAISMSIASDRDAFNTRVIHWVQRSDVVYWVFTKVFRSLFMQLIGIPREVYRSLTLEEKELAVEMLNVMHPMSLRRPGSIHEFEIEPLDGTSLEQISAPTIILHARDDALVAPIHAEFAHSHVPQSQLVLFDTGGHGLLPRMNEARALVAAFLRDHVPDLQR